MPTGEQVVFKVIRAVPQSLPKKALHISLRGCESFDDILREVRITRYDYEEALPFAFIHRSCRRRPFLSLLYLYLLNLSYLVCSPTTPSISLFVSDCVITPKLPQVSDTSAIITISVFFDAGGN